MQTKKRILFIANEMSPYLELTEFSEIVNRLAIKANEAGFEVRCIMPRFVLSMNGGIGYMKW
jgi:starch synthase